VEGAPSFLVRNEFLIRRLHSLTGLIPVGAYMVIHLVTNASVLNGAGTFQSNVYRIHSLGGLLPVVEWAFIFLPILFHAIIGVVIVAGALPNTGSYPYAANWRYSLQRWTGMIAFVFIAWHVFHMHGWIHTEAWLSRLQNWGLAQFRPYNAASTAGLALQSTMVTVLYAIGLLACVYHLANGLWTMGITWGVWTTPRSQAWASKLCNAFGIVLAIVGLGALWGMRSIGAGEPLERARQIENKMYEHRVETGELAPSEHKRATATGSVASRADSVRTDSMGANSLPAAGAEDLSESENR
jgi:succinate dehydrogenase / fumarate reductase cytochrome b subunit